MFLPAKRAARCWEGETALCGLFSALSGCIGARDNREIYDDHLLSGAEGEGRKQ